MNRINQALTREISLQELNLVSGGNGASNEVIEQQIETVVVNGSYGGVNSATISSLGASTTGNWGGGYGSFLNAYIPNALGTASRAAAHEAGGHLVEIGEYTTMLGAAVTAKFAPAGKYITGAGAVIWGLGKSLQQIEP